MDLSYGRHRQSIADIEQELHEIFVNHPQSHNNDAGFPVIPANTLVDVFRSFSEHYDGLELITKEEEDQLNQLIESNPGLEVTPQVLLQFIAMRTSSTGSPRDSPQGSSGEEDKDDELDDSERGRAEYWEAGGYHSRSSSEGSGGTSVYRSRPSSRHSSRGPPVPPSPTTPSNPSTPFDASRRQRNTPLGPPSSWSKRPAPASRRKSVDGGHSRALSDSESMSDSPSVSHSGRRSRAPSNPTSPGSYSQPTLPTYDSFSSPPSRPHSRAQSLRLASRVFGSADSHQDESSSSSSSNVTSPPLDDDISNALFGSEDGNLINGVNSLPMPRSSDSDSDDSDGEDRTLGLVMDRSAASSTVSMEPSERLEGLQRANQELTRKMMEAERSLQNILSDHEMELDEMQGRLEEVKSELSATKREEKELRAKEKQNSTQILALESEIAKLQKNLDNSRTSYQSLQKQYQEQCSESERYRNSLRRRDQDIKDLQEAATFQTMESQKWLREQTNYEERIALLENELVVAQQTHAQLEEQKQENMLLKETIDRMRYDMDELRNNAASQVAGGAASANSQNNTISKSLGAELLNKMKTGKWGLENEEEEAQRVETEEEESEGSTAVELEGDSDGTEGEDVIQTIITRTKKRVMSRGAKTEKVTFEEVKEYSDSATQYDASAFIASATTQTDPEPKILTVSSNVQTEEPSLATSGIQTDAEPMPPVKETMEMEIQTDVVEQDLSQTTQEEDEAMASSSSTLLPPTPKAQAPDLPPSYTTTITIAEQEEHDLRVAAESLKKWHPGASLPFQPVASGVSEDAIEEWKALKEELGLDCLVIDKIIAESPKSGEPRPSKDNARRRKSRLYNVYNTYVYGSKDGNDSSFPGGVAANVLLCVGASAIVFLAMSPYMVPHYAHPGPTYYDRAAWNSFNAMYPAGEGFSGDGTAAVWNLFGRLGGGAARIARGYPT